MLIAATVILPVFGLILLGYLCRKLDILGPASSGELNRFVVYLALPALLFDVMANASWHDSAVLTFGIAFSGACVAIYLATVAIACLLKRPLMDASIDGLGAAYPNAGYVGIPLCLLVLGEESLPSVTLAAVLTTFVLFTIAIVLIEAGRQNSRDPWSIVVKAARALVINPLIAAPALGALFAASGLAMPDSGETFLTLLSACASPCALIALGLFLAEERENTVEIWSAATALTAGKLIAQPIVAWFLTAQVFHLPPFLVQVAVLLAALPTGTGPFMLAEFYRRDTTATSAAVLISTVVSIGTLTLILAYSGYLPGGE